VTTSGGILRGDTTGKVRKAAAGNWTAAVPDGVWRYADFTEDELSNGLVSARYIQLRSLEDPNGGTFEIAGREFKVDILGDFNGSIDLSSLKEIYTKGIRLDLPLLGRHD
jgi:hypothetical protein